MANIESLKRIGNDDYENFANFFFFFSNYTSGDVAPLTKTIKTGQMFDGKCTFREEIKSARHAFLDHTGVQLRFLHLTI